MVVVVVLCQPWPAGGLGVGVGFQVLCVHLISAPGRIQGEQVLIFTTRRHALCLCPQPLPRGGHLHVPGLPGQSFSVQL